MKLTPYLVILSIAVVLNQGAWADPGNGTDVMFDVSTDNPHVDYSPFYNSLSHEGKWIDLPSYGYAFRPNVTEAGWAPYRNGYWAYTDAGWTWISNEPWAWATYHYGRWLVRPGVGWVWIPGNTWAPAWVSWRHGNSNGHSYYGWAPLPPEPIHGPGFNLVIGADVDGVLGIRAQDYRFVSETHFGETNYRPYYLDSGRSLGLVRGSVNLTNIRFNGAGADGFHRVTTGGPAFGDIHPSHPIARFQLTGSSAPGAGEHGFYTPSFGKREPGSARPTPHDAVKTREADTHSTHGDKDKGEKVHKSESGGESHKTETAVTHKAETKPEPGTTHKTEKEKETVTHTAKTKKEPVHKTETTPKKTKVTPDHTTHTVEPKKTPPAKPAPKKDDKTAKKDDKDK